MPTPTTIVATALPASVPLGVIALNFQAADVPNGNRFALGKKLLFAWNTHATDPYDVTITAVDDLDGRATNKVEAVAAGVIKVFGVVQVEGWAQTGNIVHFQAANAAVKFAVLTL